MNTAKLKALYHTELFNFLEKEKLLCYDHKTYWLITETQNKNLVLLTNSDKFLHNAKNLYTPHVVISPENLDKITPQLFINILKKVKKDEYPFIFKNMNKLLINTELMAYSLKTTMKIMKAIELNIGKNIALSFFENIPSHIAKIERLENLKENIKILEKYFGKINVHQYILSYIKQRAYQINGNEQVSIFCRDFLIKYYKNDENKLKEYADKLIIFNNYFNIKNNESFLNNNKIITEIIELEKLKAIMPYEGWDSFNYVKSIMNFCTIYKQSQPIQNILFNSFKENNNSFLLLTIIVNNDSHLLREDVKKCLTSFINFMKDIHNKEIFLKANNGITKTWYNNYILNEKLPIQEKNKVIIKKI